MRDILQSDVVLSGMGVAWRVGIESTIVGQSSVEVREVVDSQGNFEKFLWPSEQITHI